jgi:N-acetylglucosamine-6-phosphate deacetylase
MQAYTADKIFTGSEWLLDQVVLVRDGLVDNIIPVADLQAGEYDIIHAAYLAPAFIDLQIYGASGKLFAAYPVEDSLRKLYDHCRSGGTHHFLPTVATNTKNVFHECIDAVRRYQEMNGNGVLGLHLEGPWINPLKRGAHTRELIHPPTMKEVKEMIDYGKGIIRMITLAPEVCSSEIIKYLFSENIIVSAGHSAATYRQSIYAFDTGIPAATHLFNAMSSFHHREPGLPGAVMQHNKVMASIIPDGYHVDFEIISIAKKVMKERLFIITDAVTETTVGAYRHSFKEGRYESEGILSGSALTMAEGIRNLVKYAGIELAEALRMASLYPAVLLGLDDHLGRIKEGFNAEFVLLDENLEVVSQ